MYVYMYMYVHVYVCIYIYVYIHRVPKKGDTKLMTVTLSFLYRFSKFFH